MPQDKLASRTNQHSALWARGPVLSKKPVSVNEVEPLKKAADVNLWLPHPRASKCAPTLFQHACVTPTDAHEKKVIEDREMMD